MFFLRRKFWFTVLKIAALVYFAAMGLAQIPELRYDLGPRTPVEIDSPADLAPGRFRRGTFVAVNGAPDFDRAFVYHTHGLAHTYFLVHPYDTRLVVRTYDRVTEEWGRMDRLVGRLKPVRRQPFAHRMLAAYREKYGVSIPVDGYTLALYDVPALSGWQVAAVIFSIAMTTGLFWLFFLRGRHLARRVLSAHFTPSRPA